MFHRTERLFLRPAWPEDWEAVLGGIADEGVVMNLARVPWPYGASEAREFVSRGQDPCHPNFLIVEAASGRTIGCVGLGPKAGRGEPPELGYWLARPHWGRGYATEAAGGLIEVARVLGHQSIVAGHFVDNPASGRVLRKLGFRPTGEQSLRFSCGRGREVPSLEYALDLEEDSLSRMQAA
ncbi:GNAT family N-acetyltransferase [Tsuneonella sp. HG249]